MMEVRRDLHVNANLPIWVESEFAPLKKVVLSQSEFIFPYDEDDADDYSFLPEESIDMYEGIDVAGKNYKEVFPQRQKQWEEERRQLHTVLEKYGVEVLKPRLLTDEEIQANKASGCCNFFVRDPFFTIGSCVIEGSLRLFHRRKEILPIRDVLMSETAGGNAFYVSIPQADSSWDSETGPFLEGGDILVLGKVVFVGNSGHASNHGGYLWLKSFLSHWGYRVVEVPLRKGVLHLDCALSFPREGLMIVCEEAFPDGIPEELKNWEKIRVPYDDIAYLAINGLPINEQTYILDPRFEYIARQLQEKKIQTEFVDFQISRSFGGSFRCSTQPLLRNY